MDPITYKGSGVNYDSMDPFKIAAQEAGRKTSHLIERISIGNNTFKELSMSRGESAFLINTPNGFIAHVEEGLGTKNIVADVMYKLTGKSFYDNIAQCTVAMIVNDMITLGALPISIAMHLAVGDSNWFNDKVRSQDLINGWENACKLSRCIWGGGETPTLKGIIRENTVLLSGSAVGIISNKSNLIQPSKISHGDSIMIFESSGIHANGLTLARKIANNLRYGFRAELRNNHSYGETLLQPTHIYVGMIEDCLKAGIPIHYAVNITGHGWRKFMRAERSFRYVIEELPTQLAIFDFIQEYGPITDEEAYGNLNMGAGFAIYIPENFVNEVLGIARSYSNLFRVYCAGHIEEASEKEVFIKPKNIKFSSSTLNLR